MSELAHSVHRIDEVHMIRAFSPGAVGYIKLFVVVGSRKVKMKRTYESTERAFNRDVCLIGESFKSKNRSKDLVAIVKNASSEEFERLEIRPKKRNPK